MDQQKFIIITKEDISAWKSCQHITGNLIKSYQSAFPDVQFEFLKLEEHLSYFLAYKHAIKVRESRPDKILWLDHKPCAAFFLIALNDLYSDTPFEKRPEFLIHLFGDFVLDCAHWSQAESAINHYPVHFFTASHAEKKLVDKFFTSKKAVTSVIPFPVDTNTFSTQNLQENRESMRDYYGLKDEIVLLYTGRISFQKNVEAIIQSVEKIRSIIDKKIEIWIAGPWDDILMPFFGMRGMPGSNFSQFQSNFLSRNISGVRFLGNLDSESVLKTYHAADLFVSFSTFNDEDYGMSVAEALMTGLPCVLSDWGGFSSFAQYSDEVELTSVEARGSRMVIHSPSAQKNLMKKIMHISEKGISREMIAHKAGQTLSISSIGKLMKQTINTIDFKNDVRYSDVFYKLCSLFQVNAFAPFKNNTETYFEIYGDYGNSKL